MPTRTERAATARRGPHAYSPRAAVERAVQRGSPSVRRPPGHVAKLASGGRLSAGAEPSRRSAAITAAPQCFEERWCQDVSSLLDPAAERRERRAELDRRRAERLQRPQSAACVPDGRSRGSSRGAAKGAHQRPASAPPIITEVSEVRPGTYTLLRDVVPQKYAALDSRPKDGGQTIRAGAPFFVVKTALVHDHCGEGILRVKDASRGWISTIDRGGRNINSHTGRHEDRDELREAQREQEDEREERQMAAAKGAALEGEGSPPWISSVGGWWAGKDRRVMDERLAAAREAERRRVQPAEDSDEARQPRTADSGVSLRDELDNCFGCGDLARVEAGLARAEQRKEQVEREGMGMVVRMLTVYANGLREESTSRTEQGGRPRRAGQRPVTAPSMRVVADARTAREHAAQAFVERAPDERRPSLNAFVVGRTGA
jgi:hypothetical protein